MCIGVCSSSVFTKRGKGKKCHRLKTMVKRKEGEGGRGGDDG